MRDRARFTLPTVASAAVTQLSITDVTKTYGTRTVLDQVSFTVRPGEKAAVIGENGAGKSTLLRLLAAAERPDTGEITVSFPGGTGHLAQTLDLDPSRTVQDAVDLALTDLRAMERRLRAAEESLADASDEDLDADGELLIAYEERGGYQADARVDAAMHGLGLAGIARDRLLGSLSGGELSRLALACVLVASPELRVDVPSAITMYPRDIEKCPRPWAQERYRQIVRWRSPENGGHFPSLEVPGYFVKDLQEGLAAVLSA